MYNIAVLGDRESICGFACAGVETCPVYDDEQAKREFRRMRDGDYAVIFVTEHYAGILKDDISLVDNSITPAVIPIPGVSGNTGIGMNRISEYIEKAVGTVILD